MALSPEMLKEHFEQTKKCKIEGVISKVENIKEDSCSTNILIYLDGNNNKYFTRGVSPKKGCILDTFNVIFFEKDIKIGTEVNYILDENYSPLDYYPGTVDTSNIPYCTGNIIQEEKIETPKVIENSFNYFYEIIIFLTLIVFILAFKIYKFKK